VEGVAAVFIHCVCGEVETRRRLAERERDSRSVSDGRWDIFLVQKEVFQAPDELPAAELVTLHTEFPVAGLLKRLGQELDMDGPSG
jgi:uncharacterized protein